MQYYLIFVILFSACWLVAFVANLIYTMKQQIKMRRFCKRIETDPEIKYVVCEENWFQDDGEITTLWVLKKRVSHKTYFSEWNICAHPTEEQAMSVCEFYRKLQKEGEFND